MDIITLLIIVLVGVAIMYFFPDAKTVIQFILAVCALVWLGTIAHLIPLTVHIR